MMEKPQKNIATLRPIRGQAQPSIPGGIFFWILGAIFITFTPQLEAKVSGSGNIEFRVNGSSVPPTLTMTASGTGVGTDNPNASLHVSGNTVISKSLSVGHTPNGTGANLEIQGGMAMSFEKLKAGSNTISQSLVLADSTAGNVFLALPNPGSAVGHMITVKKIAFSNEVTVNGSIDTASSYTFTSGNLGAFTLTSDGTSWHILKQYTDAFNISFDTLFVYEGFDYGFTGTDQAANRMLHGQPDASGGDTDATGLSGTWQDSSGPANTSSDFFMYPGSLAFGDLTVSGNQARSDTNLNSDLFTRTITADIDSKTELWFSILASKLQNNFSAAEGGFVIGNQAVNNTRVLLDTGSTGLQGFGVAPLTNGSTWTAYAWDGASQTVGDASIGVTVNTGATDVRLLVGKIVWDAGAGGTDQFTLYDYQLNGGSITGGTLNPICSTIEIDVDQTTLDTLSLTRQVNTAWDEIRIGSSLEKVTPN